MTTTPTPAPQREALRRKIMDRMAPLCKEHSQWNGWPGTWCFAEAALDAIGAALSSPQPAVPAEAPMSWAETVEERLGSWRTRHMNDDGDRLALGDYMDEEAIYDLIDFVCAPIEAEPPSTPRQLPQGGEPVAWLARYTHTRHGQMLYVSTDKELADENDAKGQAQPLYAAQAPSEPVRRPLTVEHLREIYRYMDGNDVSFARAIERWHQIGGDA